MNHIDLFSGIGGFSYAFDQVFHEQKNNHIFVEIDPFCQAVLRKHWPEAEIHSDIRTFADTESGIWKFGKSSKRPKRLQPFILTGGFPCQPFSQAGRRGGTADDRYLWPAMFSVIQATRPEWVIAENVRGLATWNDGMVLEQVCADLESEGYEVQPIIIPAVAVNAPHRRDRIWFIANRKGKHEEWSERQGSTGWQSKETIRGRNSNAQDSFGKRSGRGMESDGQILERQSPKTQNERPNWEKDWIEVATRLCGVDDGIPRRLDRNPRLKALGNAIVPQVAEEIMKAIKASQ